MRASYILAGLGIATILYLTIRFLRFTYLYLRPSSLKKYCHGESPWALVTGATDGIGFGLAQELASNGFNVIVHGRNPSKLEQRMSQLNREFPNRAFRTLIADSSDASHQQMESVIAAVKGLRITVLVNNVGGGSSNKPLEDYTYAEVDRLVNVNACFPVQLTRTMIPILSNIDGPAMIMNIGSLADSFVPYAVPYGASKAFNMAMSSSLDVEQRAEGTDIEVIGISVGKVTDVGHSNDPVTFFTPGARTMARAALARLGCRKSVVVGYFGHAVQKFIFDLLPASARDNMVIPVMRGYKERTDKLT